jgi:hypothetical protein
MQSYCTSDCWAGGRSGRRCLQKAAVKQPVSLDYLGAGWNFWIYEFLFSKQNKANLEDFELKSFRNLAKVYQAMSDEGLALEVGDGSLIEICVGQLE